MQLHVEWMLVAEQVIGCFSKNILWERDTVVSKISVNGRVSAGHRKRRKRDPVDSRTPVIGRVSAGPRKRQDRHPVDSRTPVIGRVSAGPRKRQDSGQTYRRLQNSCDRQSQRRSRSYAGDVTLVTDSNVFAIQ